MAPALSPAAMRSYPIRFTMGSGMTVAFEFLQAEAMIMIGIARQQGQRLDLGIALSEAHGLIYSAAGAACTELGDVDGRLLRKVVEGEVDVARPYFADHATFFALRQI